MNPSKSNLLSGTIMTPAERRLGRYLRAPDGHPEATPGGEGNNGDGNSEPGSETQQTPNNSSGGEFDPASFWQDPAPENDVTNRSDSPPNPTPGPTPNPNDRPKDEFSQQLVSRIEGLEFEPVFTDEVAAAINTGDFKGANEAITKNLRRTVKESMVTAIHLMRRFGEEITTQLRDETGKLIDSKFTGQKNFDALTKAIPSAGDPKAGPGIRAIYDHALKHTKGDTDKAIVMTKSMLRTLSQTAAADLDLEVAPRDPHAPQNPARRVTDWSQELLGLPSGQ